MVDVSDSVAAPNRVTAAELRSRFLSGTSDITFGIVRAGRRRFTLGPLSLIEFGEPEEDGDGVSWPVTGGALTGSAGGRVGFRWRTGRLEGYLTGWKPALPGWLYRVTQYPVHVAVTRLFLLQVRGREPEPGPPAGLASRLGAAAVDAVLVAGVARLLGHRRAGRRALAIAALYHPACWVIAGRTAGGALAGLRVVSVDGSPVAVAQAALRTLLALPAAVAASDIHDRRSGTAVVRR